MTKADQSCRSNPDYSCYCECDRCWINHLSKLDRALLPDLQVPKFRHCEPCKLKFDIILRNKEEKYVKSQHVEDELNVKKEEKDKPLSVDKPLPLIDFEPTNNFMPFLDLTGERESAKRKLVQERPFFKSQEPIKTTEASASLKHTEKGIEKLSIGKTLFSIDEASSKSTEAQTPLLHLGDSSLDTEAGALNEMSEKAEGATSPSRGNTVHCGQHEGRTPDKPVVHASVSTDQNGRKIVTIKANANGKGHNMASNISPKSKGSLSATRSPRKKLTYTYKFNVRPRSGANSTMVESTPPKKDRNVVRANIVNMKHSSSKNPQRQLESLTSRSVEELLSKSASGNIRRKASNKCGSTITNCRSSDSLCSRPPWYPLRSTNRWDHYELREQNGVLTTEKQTKPPRRKSKGYQKKAPMKMVYREMGQASDYVKLPSRAHETGRKISQDPSGSTCTKWKSDTNSYVEGNMVYYKVKGKMRRQRNSENERPPSPPPPRERQGSHGNKKKVLQEESELCNVYLDNCSDTERTCCISDGATSEEECNCGCSTATKLPEECCNECETKGAKCYCESVNYVGCEECECSESNEPLVTNCPETTDGMLFIENSPYLVRGMEYDYADDINQPALYRTHSSDCACWAEKTGEVKVLEPVYNNDMGALEGEVLGIPTTCMDCYPTDQVQRPSNDQTCVECLEEWRNMNKPLYQRGGLQPYDTSTQYPPSTSFQMQPHNKNIPARCAV
ncbi:hypothetical protein BgAZ_103280 [Babesia gibsoni]|uniref:Uncharacterized protein n=1 Tax=Babesia gibsoni TaxID=33632 RepID=A0AAD8PFK0_BABGI|nr:hypothetical protein BgAZ_103280 [Babesia gibsoni]